MSNHARGRRRYRKTGGRRVWVFSEVAHDLRPETVARIITAAGLEQARLEAAALAEYSVDVDPEAPEEREGVDA